MARTDEDLSTRDISHKPSRIPFPSHLAKMPSGSPSGMRSPTQQVEAPGKETGSREWTAGWSSPSAAAGCDLKMMSPAAFGMNEAVQEEDRKGQNNI